MERSSITSMGAFWPSSRRKGKPSAQAVPRRTGQHVLGIGRHAALPNPLLCRPSCGSVLAEPSSAIGRPACLLPIRVPGITRGPFFLQAGMADMAVERTFSIIKPDATQRNLTGAINAMIEAAGLRVVA